MSEVIRPKAIIFDCWNTLFYVHTAQTTFTRLAHYALHHDLSYPLMKRIENSLQKAPQANAHEAARKLLKDLRVPQTKVLVQKTATILMSPYKNHLPYEDTLQTLDTLKQQGYKFGLLSNTYQVSFEYLIDEFDLNKRFDVVMPSYKVGMIKPDPELFHLMLKKLGTSASETAMVGDSFRDDILGAEAVGMRGILVDRHMRHPKRSDRVTALHQLPDFLLKG